MMKHLRNIINVPSQHVHILLLLLTWGWAPSANAALPAPAPAPAAAPGGLEPARLQSLLQGFVDKLYMKAFRHLGDERDFDHGHVLYAPASKTPVAILYHTQELAQDEPSGSSFGYVDTEGRNWIQWIDKGGIENANRYQREDFPDSAFWRWFKEERLPVLKQYHTIVDKMLDPARLGAETSESLQLVFTRFDCGAPPPPVPGRFPIDIRLPTGENVCLALSAS